MKLLNEFAFFSYELMMRHWISLADISGCIFYAFLFSFLLLIKLGISKSFVSVRSLVNGSNERTPRNNLILLSDKKYPTNDPVNTIWITIFKKKLCLNEIYKRYITVAIHLINLSWAEMRDALVDVGHRTQFFVWYGRYAIWWHCQVTSNDYSPL